MVDFIILSFIWSINESKVVDILTRGLTVKFVSNKGYIKSLSEFLEERTLQLIKNIKKKITDGLIF